ncbi:5-hydroxyisourate hydrolase [Bryocella elongata]|uniref:5-hydroxyisourate hydrolase n=1 Tax=Bryocella elongata TaxID=863522 RepID=A0A1H5WGX3_9BACT|nr:hydroxyisourate hydrolase [Bryocella elongata]SEF98879.1 5-hydroxyisourate hydrolase [Bryocella elongata]
MGLSTHILDTNLGRPAANVGITLYRWRDTAIDGIWEAIGGGRTDADGRCKTLLGDTPLLALDYKLRFGTSVYFYDLKVESLYPDIEIAFTVRDPAQHYHIPLLLTANGYTTYRGS